MGIGNEIILFACCFAPYRPVLHSKQKKAVPYGEFKFLSNLLIWPLLLLNLLASIPVSLSPLITRHMQCN
jgi:hypothetical protein